MPWVTPCASLFVTAIVIAVASTLLGNNGISNLAFVIK